MKNFELFSNMVSNEGSQVIDLLAFSAGKIKLGNVLRFLVTWLPFFWCNGRFLCQAWPGRRLGWIWKLTSSWIFCQFRPKRSNLYSNGSWRWHPIGERTRRQGTGANLLFFSTSRAIQPHTGQQREWQHCQDVGFQGSCSMILRATFSLTNRKQ